MKQRFSIIAPVVLIILALDQWTKHLVVRNFSLGGRQVIVEGFVDLVHVRNKGAAFGLLSQWDFLYRDYVFYLLSVVALVFLWFFLREFPSGRLVPALSAGLILGGAAGNILDRIRLGSVVDFVSVHWRDEVLRFDLFGEPVEIALTWPAFNVADSAITVGVFCLLFLTVCRRPCSHSSSITAQS